MNSRSRQMMCNPLSRQILYTVGLLLLLLPSLTHAQNATDIYKNLEPSIVQITTNSGVGSGVLLTADGLILTNFHVINRATLISVETMVSTRERIEFSGAILEKTHKTNDLALIRIKPGKHTLRPASLARAETDTQTGGICYAIGYPYFQSTERPALTITKGIISSTNRQIAGQTFIQLDAAINPGNSGGALVNMRGQVVGIITAKVTHSESVGLAIPTHNLSIDQFDVDGSVIDGFPEYQAPQEVTMKRKAQGPNPLPNARVPHSRHSDQKITAKVEFDNSTSIELVDVPSGVTYDPETQTLQWIVSPFTQIKSVKALFNVTDQAGDERLEIFILTR